MSAIGTSPDAIADRVTDRPSLLLVRLVECAWLGIHGLWVAALGLVIAVGHENRYCSAELFEPVDGGPFSKRFHLNERADLALDLLVVGFFASVALALLMVAVPARARLFPLVVANFVAGGLAVVVAFSLGIGQMDGVFFCSPFSVGVGIVGLIGLIGSAVFANVIAHRGNSR